ncbi:hypothetical protein K0U07_02590 [bacterium]|nr:hypothetical protein [bacterium]
MVDTLMDVSRAGFLAYASLGKDHALDAADLLSTVTRKRWEEGNDLPGSSMFVLSSLRVVVPLAALYKVVIVPIVSSAYQKSVMPFLKQVGKVILSVVLFFTVTVITFGVMNEFEYERTVIDISKSYIKGIFYLCDERNALSNIAIGILAPLIVIS